MKSSTILLPLAMLIGSSTARINRHPKAISSHPPRQDSPVSAPAPAPAPAPPVPVPAPPPAPEPTVVVSVPPAQPPPAPPAQPVPAPSAPVPPGPSPVPGSSGGPNCGKGYTYCGYMLSENGHNFTPEQVSDAYCEGLTDHCAGQTSKTDVDQAVFVCLDDEPNSSIKLLCACAGQCLNDPGTNNIAHCNAACYN